MEETTWEELAQMWYSSELLNDCWNNYRDVYALPLNAMALGDVDNYRPTIVQRKIECVR
jgi:hypothetical protein